MRKLPVVAAAAFLAAASFAQQPNTSNASLVVNGVGANLTGPFSIPVAPPQTISLAFGGAALQPFVLFNANPGLGGNITSTGLPTAYGLADITPVLFPTIEILLDGVGNAGTLMGALATLGTAGTTTLNATLTNVPCGTAIVNLQAAMVAPSQPAGVLLSAASQLHYGLQPVDAAPVAVSQGDDVTTQVLFAGCSSFTFYGNAYRSLYVNSNGNVTFGAGDTSLSESQSTFNSGRPRIAAAWDDLNAGTTGSGTITKMDNGQSILVQWTNVPEYQAVGSNTFSIRLDLQTNLITVAYGAMSLTDCLAGITPGSSLAAPVTVFGIGAVNGRMLDHLSAGTLGPYNGAAMESLNELFVTTATATAGPFNLANQTVSYLPMNPAVTAYGML